MGALPQSLNDDAVDLITAYLVRLADQRRSPDTIKLRRKILTKLHHDLPFGITRACQSELEAWLRGCATANTLATYWVAMRTAYKFWCDPRDPWLIEDPTRDMTPRTFPRGRARPGSEQRLEVILSRGEQPYRLWALLAAFQGLRCCEISGLDREHITAEELFVVRGKGGRPRVQDTDPLVWEAVRDLPPGPIARTPDGLERATAAQVSKRANHHFQTTLGLDGLTMHMWRHRLGVQAQRAYKNIRVTQRLLGHETINSTQIYTDADLDELRAARAMLPRPGVPYVLAPRPGAPASSGAA